LSSATEVATGLIRAAVSCSSLRPAVLLEIAGFACNRKPALRFVVDEVDAKSLVKAAEALELYSCINKIFISEKRNGWSEIVSTPTPVSQSLICIDHDGRAEKLMDAELADGNQAGLMLGYPVCCVKALAETSAAAENWAIRLLCDAKIPVNARLNRFAAEWGGIGLIGELFPCSLECRHATAYAQSLYDSAVELGLGRLASAAKTDAMSSVVVEKNGSIHKSEVTGSVEFFW